MASICACAKNATDVTETKAPETIQENAATEAESVQTAEPVQETEAETEPEEVETAEASPILQASVIENTQTCVDPEGMTAFATVKYPAVILAPEDGKRFPKLASALDKNNEKYDSEEYRYGVRR